MSEELASQAGQEESREHITQMATFVSDVAHEIRLDEWVAAQVCARTHVHGDACGHACGDAYMDMHVVMPTWMYMHVVMLWTCGHMCGDMTCGHAQHREELQVGGGA